jgi:hypothetical protein
MTPRRLSIAVVATISAGAALTGVTGLLDLGHGTAVASAAPAPGTARADHLDGAWSLPTALPTALATASALPSPTAVATPAAIVVAALSRPASAAPARVNVTAPQPRSLPTPPPVRRNYLTSGDGTLGTSVGVYADCSGRTPLTHSEAAIDTCFDGPAYFVGHNAGVFTPLMHMGVGALITYHDGNGTAHLWRVVSVRPAWHSADGTPPVTEGDVVAQLQTCAVPDGSIDRILDVVQA